MQGALTIVNRRNFLVITSLSGLLGIVTIFSLTVGAVSIPFSDAFIIILQQFGLLTNVAIDETFQVVMSSIRLPRIFMTLAIGASLGISGASLQGLFRNPLVEPSLIGVSGGSAAAVVAIIVFGAGIESLLPGWIFNSLITLAAFAGGAFELSSSCD